MGKTARLFAFAAVLAAAGAQAQETAKPGTSLAEKASRSFPEPVSAGSLLGRSVLQAVESEPTLGRVDGVVRRTDGSIDVVMRYGGVLGLFSHRIAVPVDGMALLGQYLEVVDFTPQQLSSFPRFDPAGTTPLASDAVVRIGLARPPH